MRLKMRPEPILKAPAALAAGLAMALPSHAIAASRDCDALKALASPSDSKLRKIAVAMNRESKLDITYDGKRGLLRGADDCEIEVSNGDFQLECEWDFGDSEARARGVFSAYRIRMAECLGPQFAALPESQTTGTSLIDGYELEIEDSSYNMVIVGLRLRKYSSGERTRYSIGFEAIRD